MPGVKAGSAAKAVAWGGVGVQSYTQLLQLGIMYLVGTSVGGNGCLQATSSRSPPRTRLTSRRVAMGLARANVRPTKVGVR
eukprot:COSAG02_NODE_6292_length_3672_cov_20.164288_3_plen_81_part_00